MGNSYINHYIESPNEVSNIKALRLKIEFKPNSGIPDISGACISAIKIESPTPLPNGKKADYILELSDLVVDTSKSEAIVWGLFNYDIQDVFEEYRYGHNFSVSLDLAFAPMSDRGQYRFSVHMEDSEKEFLDSIKSISIYAHGDLPTVHTVHIEDW